MRTLLIGILQVITSSGILYGYYHFFLRNKQFHQYNRFYLLGTVLISLLIPFLQIPVYFDNDGGNGAIVLTTLQSLSGGWEEPVVVTGTAAPSIDWLQVAKWSYITIVVLLLIRILRSLFKIRSIIRQHRVERLDGINFINTNEPGTPFSFFRWLFWHRKIDLSSSKGEQIFRHEIFHIQQKHSWDVFFTEIVLTICWINPFYHIIRREIRAIHEFLADQFAVDEKEKWSYAELLLMQALETRQSLVNPFFHNQIKRRIAMITNPQTTSHKYLRKLLVLPIAALVLTLFAFNYKQSEGMREIPVDDPTSLILQFAKTDQVMEVPLTDTSKPVMLELKPAPVPIKDGGVTRLQGLNVLDAEQPLFVINGVIATNKNILDTLNPNTIKSINILKNTSATALYGNQAVNGVIEIQTNPVGVLPLKLTESKGGNADLDEVVVVGYSKNPGVAEKRFETTEEPAQFPGGSNAWRKYLERNLDVNAPINKKAPLGNYTVYVQFIVSDDGSISDIRPLTAHGYGMEDEAMRVIRSGPKWIPAKQNGKVVNSYRKQPITFVIYPDNAQEDAAPKETVKEVTVVGYPIQSKISGEVTVTGIQSKPKTTEEVVVQGYASKPKAQEEVTVSGYQSKPKAAEEVVVQGYASKSKAQQEVTVSGYQSKPKAAEEVVVQGYASKPKAQEEVVVTGIRKESTNQEKPVTLSLVPTQDLALIYPNPSSQQANVSINHEEGGKASVLVTDLNGRQISNRSVTLVKGRNNITVGTSDFAKGTYIVSIVENGKKTFSCKLVKE